jgi:segregation and condensation protein A
MAATLIRIKAQMLLPSPMEEEDGDPRAELVRRLLEYEQIREISVRLRSAEADRGRRFGKGYVPPRPKMPQATVPLETTWDEVYAAALLVEMPVPREREHRITIRTVSMQAKVVVILDALREEPRVEFTRLLTGFTDRMHGVMTFLAGLELTRRGVLLLRQTRPFSELWIYRRNEQVEKDAPAEAEAPEQARAEPHPHEGVEA